ncbi:MAG: SDR family NAD(P)-dependent oxidoreductase, partial [Aquincola sp.]|nr:SDR family NAD(P)-dependent oxidoreductase [Aquincola sp.]
WAAVEAGDASAAAPFVSLPPTPFELRRHWIEAPAAATPVSAAAPPRLSVVEWRPVPAVPPASASSARASLVVFDDGTALGRALLAADALENSPVRILAGTAFSRIDERTFALDPNDPGQFRLLVQAMAELLPPDRPWQIVQAWSRAETGADARRMRVLCTTSTMWLLQALGASRAAKCRLAIVTACAHAIAAEPATRPEGAAAGPLCRAIALEYPGLRAAHLDILPPLVDADDAVMADAIRAEFAADLPSPFVAWRGGRRLEPATRDLPPVPVAPARLRQGGAWLVTGGLGGIGRTLAEMLARRHGASLMLTSRTPLPPEAQWASLAVGDDVLAVRLRWLLDLRRSGVDVQIVSADACDATAMAAVVSQACRRWGRLSGAIHAAGVPGGGLLNKRTPDEVARVFGAKVDGARVLLELLADEPLDALVLCSSLDAHRVTTAQADYAAANAVLDALAASARGRPAHVLSIAWDAWADVGMAFDAKLPEPLRAVRAQRLRNALSRDQALAAFEQALGVGAAVVLVRSPADAAPAASEPIVSIAAPKRLPATREEVFRRVEALWRDLLGHDSIDPQANFFDVGGSSLTMIELRQRVMAEFGITLPIVEMFAASTTTRLAAGVHALLLGKGDVPLPAEPAVRVGATERGTAIAIVGMSGRFPGMRSLDEFWHNLENGVQSIRMLDEAELARAGARSRSDRAQVHRVSQYEDADLFDAAFFGMSPREAELTDPSQRLLLLCAHEALEDAGYVGRRPPPRTGVFAGVAASSYLATSLLPLLEADDDASMQISLGNDKDFAATRLSYKLDLQGPSVNVNTACSTSLVAVHQACRSLLGFECDLALAGGARVKAPMGAGYRYREGGILSPDGCCRAFDADARGTVFGSGAGVVVLKRLEDALRDGDVIHGVVLGSAVNNDGGRKVGFTAPSVRGQADVIFEALGVAGVEPETVGLVEAHGTATALGDPIEVAALSEVFRASTPRTGFCALGSVKTNIGHLDTAAGVAGLIKAVLALKHRRIPPSLHFERPNPQIDLAASPFYVPREARDWHAQGPRRAGVSSFGIGGTNAHVVLQEAPTPVEVREQGSRDAQLLVLSARSGEGLRQAAARLGEHLRAHPQVALPAVARTLRHGRATHEHRLSVVARTPEQAAAALAAVRVSGAAARQELPVMFLFPGQGSQHAGMLAQLHASEPVFSQTLEQCLGLLGELGEELRGLLRSPGAQAQAQLAQTRLTQPALFCTCYALARQWQAWGVQPTALLGHSVGEYVAACLAGVFALPDALALVAERGRLMQSMPPGAMLAVSLGEAQLSGRLGELSLAAVNAATQCVVAGPHEPVQRLGATLQAEGVRVRMLETSHAFHSQMMAPLVARFERLVAGVARQAPVLPFVSNVSGTWITEAQARDPGYWASQLREPVRFHEGVGTLLGRDGALLEVGPNQVVSGLARMHPQAAGRTVVASARLPQADAGDAQALLSALGQLWAAGVAVDWAAVEAGDASAAAPFVSLPPTPFELRRHWIEAPAAATPVSAAAPPR